MASAPDLSLLPRAVNIPFPMRGWGFDTLPHALSAQPLCERVFAWATDPNVRERLPLLVLTGDAGTGKTGLLVSTLVRVAHQIPWHWPAVLNDKVLDLVEQDPFQPIPCPVYFDRWRTLLLTMRELASAQYGSDYRWFARYKAPAVLGIDDLDVGSKNDEREMLMLALLDRLDSGKQLIVTMNDAPKRLVPVFGERVVDRLTDTTRSLHLHLTANSFRKRKGDTE
jgi:DNA replication protein DnaC